MLKKKKVKKVEKVEEVKKIEDFETKIDKAATKVIEKLGFSDIETRLASLETPKVKKVEKKIAGILNLEKLMKKDVSEMTANEKIIGFFQAAIKNDKASLKALAEGVAADGGLRKYSPICV